MKIIGVQSRVSPFLIAVVLLLQHSPALATGQLEAQQATIQGRQPVEVTFTKWRTAGVSPPPAVATRSLFRRRDDAFFSERFHSRWTNSATSTEWYALPLRGQNP